MFTMGWKVAAVVSLLGLVGSGFSYVKGYNKGKDVGYQTASDECYEKERQWNESIIKMQNDNIQLVDDLNRAVDAAKKKSELDVNRLNERVRSLRNEAKFSGTNASCDLSDDELRYLREANRVRSGSDSSTG